jgi:hypothetical protein
LRAVRPPFVHAKRIFLTRQAFAARFIQIHIFDWPPRQTRRFPFNAKNPPKSRDLPKEMER